MKIFIGIKLKLDNQMLVAPDVTLAPLYYKLGIIYKAREMKDESIESFSNHFKILRYCSCAKAAAQLKSMGVVVAAPEKKRYRRVIQTAESLYKKARENRVSVAQFWKPYFSGYIKLYFCYNYVRILIYNSVVSLTLLYNL